MLHFHIVRKKNKTKQNKIEETRKKSVEFHRFVCWMNVNDIVRRTVMYNKLIP